MNPAEEFLKKLGLTFEELDSPGHSGEKDAYYQLLKDSQQRAFTVDDVRIFIIQCRHAVEMELTDPKHDKSTDDQLKARLRCYIILEAFLYSPAQAVENHKKDIEKMVAKK